MTFGALGSLEWRERQETLIDPHFVKRCTFAASKPLLVHNLLKSRDRAGDVRLCISLILNDDVSQNSRIAGK